MSSANLEGGGTIVPGTPEFPFWGKGYGVEAHFCPYMVKNEIQSFSLVIQSAVRMHDLCKQSEVPGL